MTSKVAEGQWDSGAAAAPAASVSRSHPLEHEVRRGDRLLDICRQHNVSWRSMMIANPSLRNPDLLEVGSRIKIPGPEFDWTPALDSPARPARPAVPAPLPTAERKLPVVVRVSFEPEAPSRNQSEMSALGKVLSILLGQGSKKKLRQYKVEEGDTLEWLAVKFGTTVKSIQRLNKMKDDLICTGSVLKIERSIAFERQNRLGRKASVQERAISELGHGIDSSMRSFVSPTGLLSVIVPHQKSRRQSSLAPKIVKVKSGDTLLDIAQANRLSISELQRLNSLRDDVIIEGDVLAVSSGPSTAQLLELREGRRRTSRPLFSRQIHGVVGIGGPQPSHKSESLPREGRHKRRQKAFHLQNPWSRFKSPLTTGFITSPFGWRWGAFHEGIDLAADQGTPILASDRGTVLFAGWSGGYGYLISIQHDGGFVTRYAHCCAIHTRVGQQVSRGQHVAAVGSTGHATGPHLHFEVRKNGEALDPIQWVKL